MIRPDGLVKGSCGPLSRRHAERLVGYGFFAPDGDRSGSWQMSPSDYFRATKIYAWKWKDESARIESLCFGNDEQLVEGSSLPADLFACWASPEQFLALYAGLDVASPGFHRVFCKHLPAQQNFVVPLDFPTLSIVLQLSIRWTGSLTAQTWSFVWSQSSTAAAWRSSTETANSLKR